MAVEALGYEFEDLNLAAGELGGGSGAAEGEDLAVGGSVRGGGVDLQLAGLGHLQGGDVGDQGEVGQGAAAVVEVGEGEVVTEVEVVAQPGFHATGEHEAQVAAQGGVVAEQFAVDFRVDLLYAVAVVGVYLPEGFQRSAELPRFAVVAQQVEDPRAHVPEPSRLIVYGVAVDVGVGQQVLEGEVRTEGRQRGTTPVPAGG